MTTRHAPLEIEPALRRTLRAVRPDGTHIIINGRRALNCASNDYLGLSQHPQIVAAARAALESVGVGAGASALISGWTEPHRDLARRLAEWKHADAALVTATGFAANLATVSALIDRHDCVVADRRNHASLLDAERLTGARVRHYRHLDIDDARRLLARNADSQHRFILTDGVFSMDGTIAPLDELVGLAREFDAMLIVDDAHGSGVVGPDGRGTPALFGVENEVDVVVGTLSKAFGGQGGFVTASQRIIDRITNRGRAFIYSTALAPAMVAAADAALDVIARGHDRRQRQRANITAVREALQAQEWRILGDPAAPMLALHVGAADVAVHLSDLLLEAGVFAPAIRPPTVHPGESRIRLVPTAMHTDDDIAHLIRACAACRPMVTAI